MLPFPYIQLKTGASFDGRTAMASTAAITSPGEALTYNDCAQSRHLTSSATVLAMIHAQCVGLNPMNKPGAHSTKSGQPACIVIDR